MKGKRKVTKRIAAWLMCLAMVLTTINLPVFTTEVKAETTTVEIDGIKYTLDDTNYTAKVEAKDPKYTGDIIIPQTVTYNEIDYSVNQIAAKAFDGCSDLTSVVIPDSVITIESYAFRNCNKLESIIIPNSVTKIYDYVFQNCSNLQNITIPNSVKELGNHIFDGCTGLTTIEIPDKVEIIYSGAFYNCSGLKNISMPCRLRTLKDLSIPEGVEVTYRHLDGATESCSDVIYSYERFYTGRVWYKLACNGVLNITGFGTGYVSWDDTLDEALSKNEVKEIIISDVYKVDVNAFIDFSNLTSVTIGENIKAIGENAFSGCNKLSSIVIPESVETIGSGVFEGCTGLRSISMPCRFRTAEDLGIPSDVEIIYTHVSDEAAASCEEIVDSGITDDGLYYELTCNGTLTISGAGDMSSLKWLGTDIKTVIIEEGVTGIGVMVFQNCSNLSSITIPDTVNDIGYRAFYNCSKLSEIVIPNGVRYIGESTFAECPSLINVTIPDTVESIDDSAFEGCINLVSVDIPDSVTSIRWGAFKNCTSLSNISIPSSVISLGNSVFSGCTSLTSITIPGSIASISQTAFEDCTKLSRVTISDDVTSIDSGAFKGCTSLESITIPHSIAIIGYEAFAGCSKLKNVTIANGVNIIEGMAFKDCTGLTNITIPDSVREMFSGAFSGCTNLNSVTMPCRFATTYTDFGFPDSANITYVHNYVDGNCVNIVYSGDGGDNISYELTCGGKLTLSGTGDIPKQDWDFPSEKVKEVVISSGITSISQEVFANCSSLSSVTIPSSVTSIGADAFYDCTKLTNITLHCGLQSSVESWKNHCNASLNWIHDFSDKGICVCGYHESCNKGNHDFSEQEYKNDGKGKHYRICALCTSESEHEACSGGTATCQKKAVCSLCKNEYGDLAAHTWNDGEITTAATCKTKGVKTFKCTVTGCTATKTEEVAIDSTNHVNTEVLGKKDATCTEKGYTGDTHCKDCDETVTGTEIQATGHDMTKTVSAKVPATCEKDGKEAVMGCKNCDHEEGGAVIPAKGHTWDAGEITTPATCKTKGVKTFKCTVEGCTGTKTEEIVIDANNHVNKEVVGKKDATCTEKGYTGDTHCKDCDTTVTGTDIAATGHDMTKTVSAKVPATCEKDGKEAVMGCKNCDHTEGGAVIKATGHKWDNGTVTKQPTVTAEGIKTFKCTNTGCNETKTEAIAKLPEPKKNEVIEDKTGNDYKVTDPAKKEVTYKAPADKKAKTITIPARVQINGITYKVTKIDDKAFKGNTTVTKVVIPSSVTVIGAEAFSGCKNLTTVSIPKNVTQIGKNAFKGCAKLTKLTLPSKCTKIGAGAFDGCKKMKTITIKSTKLTSKSVSANAFKGLSKNVTIKVPKKQLKAYKSLLKKKGFKGKVK